MKSRVTYDEIKSNSTKQVDAKKYMILLKIWQDIYYGERRKNPIKKTDLIFRYGKDKEVVEKVWECFYDLKIEWPYEMYDRVYDV